jgi:hypothetical protein
MIGFQCFPKRTQPGFRGGKAKAMVGFAHLSNPTYAGANVGHPPLLGPDLRGRSDTKVNGRIPWRVRSFDFTTPCTTS